MSSPIPSSSHPTSPEMTQHIQDILGDLCTEDPDECKYFKSKKEDSESEDALVTDVTTATLLRREGKKSIYSESPPVLSCAEKIQDTLTSFLHCFCCCCYCEKMDEESFYAGRQGIFPTTLDRDPIEFFRPDCRPKQSAASVSA